MNPKLKTERGKYEIFSWYEYAMIGYSFWEEKGFEIIDNLGTQWLISHENKVMK